MGSPVERPQGMNRPGRIRSLRLGDLKVSFVPDGFVQGRPRRWLPDSTDEVWAARPEYLDDTGHLVASVGGLLVERDDRALLIDVGLGPQSTAATPDSPNGAMHGGALIDNLAVLGRAPEQIEMVALTHLHPDHTGWLATGSNGPTFPGADYMVSESEWIQGDVFTPELRDVIGSKAQPMSDGQEVFPGVHVRSAHGHTPGHCEYVITADDKRLIAFGDSMHSPIQVEQPEWSCVYDHDPKLATGNRRRLLAELEDLSTVGFGIHFADVMFGQVNRIDNNLTWTPVPATELRTYGP